MFFSKKPEKETILILDIGNGSVGGSLVEVHEHGHPKIFYSHREPYPIQSEKDSKTLLESMTRLLSSVLSDIHTNAIPHADFLMHGKQKIRDIYCVFSSPWYMSQTKTLKIEKNTPFTVSKKFVEEVVNNEEKIFRSALENGNYGHVFKGPVRVIEHHIIETRINGYGLDSPIGKSGKTFEISLFTSVVAEEIIAKVEKEIHKHFNYKESHFNSFSLVSFSTVRDLYPGEESFMFLDITGEVTDVSITRKNVLLETISFPLGRASLIRKLSKNIGVSPALAISYIRLYSEKGLTADASTKLTRALESFGREWSDYFHKAILELCRDIALPKKIFFTADHDTAEFFSKLIMNEKTVPSSEADKIIEEEFSVTYLDLSKLHSVVDLGPRGGKDEFIALESIFFNKLFAAKHSSSIIGK